MDSREKKSQLHESKKNIQTLLGSSIILPESMSQSVDVGAYQEGDIVFSQGFGSCIAVVAFLNNDKVALLYALGPETDAVTEFAKSIKGSVDQIFVLQKLNHKSNFHNAILLTVKLGGLLGAEVSRIQVKRYEAIACIATAPAVWISENKIQQLSSAESPSIEIEQNNSFKIISYQDSVEELKSLQQKGVFTEFKMRSPSALSSCASIRSSLNIHPSKMTTTSNLLDESNFNTKSELEPIPLMDRISKTLDKFDDLEDTELTEQVENEYRALNICLTVLKNIDNTNYGNLNPAINEMESLLGGPISSNQIKNLIAESLVEFNNKLRYLNALKHN